MQLLSLEQQPGPYANAACFGVGTLAFHLICHLRTRVLPDLFRGRMNSEIIGFVLAVPATQTFGALQPKFRLHFPVGLESALQSLLEANMGPARRGRPYAVDSLRAGRPLPSKVKRGGTNFEMAPVISGLQTDGGVDRPIDPGLDGGVIKTDARRDTQGGADHVGWAKRVYAHLPGTCFVQPRARRKEDALPMPTRAVSQRRILIFRVGQLGDTLVALPSIWLIKKHFPDASIALLCDRHPGKKYVLASDLLRETGIFDDFLSYPVSDSGRAIKSLRMLSLMAAIRNGRYDTLVYLAPNSRSPEQIARDRRFFSMSGIKEFIGMEGFTVLPAKEDGVPLADVPPESELLLKRLSASGINVSKAARNRVDLLLSERDELDVEQWRQGLPSNGSRPWLAVAPGSKMPSKHWPANRFEEVVKHLIDQFDIWPVVFGGEEDRIIGGELLACWKRGYNAAGELGLRPATAALRRCILFLGNDTGTMHMAAAVGVPCVAVFSSRERPGLWYPHGEGHRVFRTQIDCEGCGLVECVARKNECLRRITAAEVLDGCGDLLRKRLASAPAAV